MINFDESSKQLRILIMRCFQLMIINSCLTLEENTNEILHVKINYLNQSDITMLGQLPSFKQFEIQSLSKFSHLSNSIERE